MKKRIFIFISLVAVSLTSCQKDPGEVKFAINDISATEIHTNLQKGFIDSEDPDFFIKQNDNYENNFARKSQSAPIGIKVSYKVTTDNGVTGSYKVVTSETSDFATSYEHPASSDSAELYNLKFNTKYFYKVKGYYKSTTFESEVKEFTTSNSKLRNIFAEGVENVRDIGGYLTESGKYMKQGLIYRTAQFNYNHSDEDALPSEPTSRGREVLIKQLGLKTEVDIREKVDKKGNDETNGITSSPLGSSVNYVSLPMRYGGSNPIREENKDNVKAFLELCAKEENYPLAFHCVRGTDRTGALAYVLGALCGASKEDLIKDYLFSNFANINGGILKTNNIDGSSYYVYGIENSTGETMSQKAKNYLIDRTGVSEATLNSISSILVG